MSTFRERVNSHLPIVLQLISSGSLLIIALAAICGSKSLKKMIEVHELQALPDSQQIHMLNKHHKH